MMMRHKVFFAINILGMGIALSFCIVAWLNYQFDKGFANTQVNANSIYRVDSYREEASINQPYAISPLPLGEVAAREVPGVKNFARLGSFDAVVRSGDHVFYEHIYSADPNLTDIFSLNVIEGELASLRNNDQLVITQRIADKYFPDEPAVGKQLMIRHNSGKEKSMSVGAVIENFPINTSFGFPMLTNLETWLDFEELSETDWSKWSYGTILELNHPEEVSQVEQRLQAYLEPKNAASSGWKLRKYTLLPLQDWAHSSEKTRSSFLFTQSLPYSAVIGPNIMAILILLLACFNFINISLAMVGKRLKEIGIRKVLGGNRAQLIRQILGENVLMCFLALLCALVIADFLVPAYSNLWAFLDLELNLLDNLNLWGFLLGLLLVTAILAGAYPAFYISRFHPLSILKGTLRFGGANKLKTGLLVAQFAIALLSIITGIGFAQNASYQNNLDMGFDRNRNIVIPFNGSDQYETLAQEIRSLPNVEMVSGTSNIVGRSWDSFSINIQGKTWESDIMNIGATYPHAAGIQLHAGRFLSDSLRSDQNDQIMVNQKFLEEFQIEDPFETVVRFDSTDFQIAGVLEDFHTDGFFDVIHPCILRAIPPQECSFAVVRAKESDLTALMPQIEQVWYKVAPHTPFSAFYQESTLDEAKQITSNIQLVSWILALVALFMSGTGLFSLVSLNLLRRTREMGIRKVLGATLAQIARLLSRELIIIMIFASIFGTIGGYMLGSFFLNNIYAYHAGIGASVIFFAIFLLVLTGIGAVGTKIYQAARANPIESLRYE